MRYPRSEKNTMRDAVGTASFSSSSRLPVNSEVIHVTPVTLPFCSASRITCLKASHVYTTSGILLTSSWLIRGADRPWTGRHDDIDLRLDELGGKSGEAIAVSFRPAVLDRNGLTLDPAQRAQTSVEPQFRGHRWGAAVSEISNPRDPGGLPLAVERRQGEAEHESDREPDPAHEHLGEVGWLAGV